MLDSREKPDRVAIIGGVLAMVLFSGNFVSSRHGLGNGLSVADLVLIRYAVAGPLFLALLLRIGMGGLAIWRGVVLALLGGAPYFLLTAAALEFAPATHASVLNPGGTMVCAPLLGWLVLRERPGPGVRLGLPILGAGLLMIGGASLLEGGGRTWIGDLLLFWSGFDWALYGVLMRRWRVGGLRTACIMGAFSLAWVPVHLAVLGMGGIPANAGEAAIQASYQGLVAGGLGVILYSRAVAALGPARGALLPPLVPALGTFWAWLILGEEVTPLQATGMVTVIAGMLVGALWRRETRETIPRAARHSAET
ncbi:MAG: DMT family transporter [Acetobacteraceae bacterium]|nr:DMT family transporter [Acetobacteraceae bacterium]